MNATIDPFAALMPKLRFSAGRTLPVSTTFIQSYRAVTVPPSGRTITSKFRYVCAAIALRHSSSIQLPFGQAITTDTSGFSASGRGTSALA